MVKAFPNVELPFHVTSFVRRSVLYRAVGTSAHEILCGYRTAFRKDNGDGSGPKVHTDIEGSKAPQRRINIFKNNRRIIEQSEHGRSDNKGFIRNAASSPNGMYRSCRIICAAEEDHESIAEAFRLKEKRF